MVDSSLDVNLVTADVEKLLYFHIWSQRYPIGQICEITDFKLDEAQRYFCSTNAKYSVDYITMNSRFSASIFYDCSIKTNHWFRQGSLYSKTWKIALISNDYFYQLSIQFFFAREYSQNYCKSLVYNAWLDR